MTNRRVILGTVFLDALGYGLVIPVLPDVVRRFDADPSSVSRCFGYFIALYAVVQFAAISVLGNLSDRYGRRPVLLASLAGAAIDYLLMAYAPTLWLLFVGRVVSGLTGASMAVAYACMADISDERNRAANFGLVAAALGVGIVTGPGIGGVLAHVGLTAPFLMAAGLNFLNFAAALLLLPEALGVGARRRIELARWTPRAVPPDAQGELQGNLLSLASLSAIAGPLVYTSVFARGIRDSQNVLLTGAPFLVAAAFSLLAWLLVGRREPPHETQQVPAATAARGAGGLAGGSPWTRLDG